MTWTRLRTAVAVPTRVAALLLIFLLAPCSASVASEAARGFEVYTAEDGLGCDELHCVRVGPGGKVWFGTNAGLTRFDGSSWERYAPGEEPGARDSAWNSVLDITFDELGRPWVAAWGAGVRLFEAGHFLRLPGGDYVYWATAVCWAASGELWVGSGTWIGKFTPGSGWQFYSEWSAPWGANMVFSFANDDRGNVLAATYDRVCLISDGGNSWRYHQHSLRSRYSDVCVLVDGSILAVGSDKGALVEISDDGLEWTLIHARFDDTALFCATPDPEGGAWFGTCGGAIFWDRSEWRWVQPWYGPEQSRFGPKPGKGDVVDISIGPDGQVWFATSGLGAGVLPTGLAQRPASWLELRCAEEAISRFLTVYVSAVFEMDVVLDFYLAVVLPDGRTLFAPFYESTPRPLFPGVSVRGRESFDGLPAVELNTQGVPAGKYFWFAACTYAGTMDLASNIASCEWQFEE